MPSKCLRRVSASRRARLVIACAARITDTDERPWYICWPRVNARLSRKLTSLQRPLLAQRGHSRRIVSTRAGFEGVVNTIRTEWLVDDTFDGGGFLDAAREAGVCDPGRLCRNRRRLISRTLEVRSHLP